MSSGSVVVPGEFRVDTGSHKLYYRPRLTPIEQQTIIAPTVDRINDIDGASDIHFEGPTFKVSNGLLEVLPSLVLHSNVKGGLIHLGTARCWDPSQPNEEYSRHVDYIVNKAESLGLYVGATQTRWYDPREGTYQDVGRFPTIGTRGFSWNEVTGGPQESRTGTPARQSAMEDQTGKSARPTKKALQPHAGFRVQPATCISRLNGVARVTASIHRGMNVTIAESTVFSLRSCRDQTSLFVRFSRTVPGGKKRHNFSDNLHDCGATGGAVMQR